MEAHIVTGEEGVQGSQAWLDFKMSKISASEIAIILGISPWSSSTDLWKRKVGFLGGQQDNINMAYGREMESSIREYINELLGKNFVPIVAQNKKQEWRIASLDGYDFETSEVLEIKCANKKDHEDAKQGKVPKKYWPQAQFQLSVMGVKKAYYASYHQGDTVIVDVDYDPDYIQRILPTVAEFYRCVVELEQPRVTEEEDELKRTVSLLREARDEKKRLCEIAKDLEAQVLEIVGTKEINSDYLKITEVERQSSTDWVTRWNDVKQLYKDIDEKFPVEQYTSSPSKFWKITPRKKDEY